MLTIALNLCDFKGETLARISAEGQGSLPDFGHAPRSFCPQAAEERGVHDRTVIEESRRG
jgi:hypothetical protein